MANVRQTHEKKEAKQWRALGIMSGTSLDGVDICHCKFRLDGEKWHFEILHTNTYPYPNDWQHALTFKEDLSAANLLRLDHKLGLYLGKLTLQFLKDFDLTTEGIDLIASHGHTLYHRPQEDITLQIGNGPEIFAQTGITTITDFRKQDVALGGQGAPLVPIGDKMLFSQFEACLNLGGFANISFEKEGKRVAYDICPVNFVLNHLAQSLGKKYDADGELARSGAIAQALLSRLDAMEFYSLPHPKSLGAEWVWSSLYPILNGFSLSAEDGLRTVCEHVANQISKTLNTQCIKTCMVSGGGVYNTFLMELIRQKTKCQIHIPKPEIIEFREALIFAFIGLLKQLGQINILASVTGAARDHSSGVVYGISRAGRQSLTSHQA